VDGHGIVLKSIWDVSADLAAGRLTLLMPEWRTAEAPVHALYPRSRYQPPRVRALLEFLRDKFEQASAQMDI
jgi:DNA-binding transcriptional LysR family regulator